jgi:hypothetical protein
MRPIVSHPPTAATPDPRRVVESVEEVSDTVRACSGGPNGLETPLDDE